MVKAGRRGPPGDVSGDAAAGVSRRFQALRRLFADAMRRANARSDAPACLEVSWGWHEFKSPLGHCIFLGQGPDFKII
jgi:hypothetical protein